MLTKDFYSPSVFSKLFWKLLPIKYDNKSLSTLFFDAKIIYVYIHTKHVDIN